MIAARALMNLTAQAAYLELCLSLGRPISAVRVNIRKRIGFVQKPIEFLTVMHARVGHVILPNQLVPGIGIHVVLVSIETLAVLLGPARILVFLPVFRRIFLPGPGRLAGLYILIFVTTITLLGNWNDRRINHLAAASGVALRFQMLAETLEQFLNETGLRKRLPEQPKRRAVGNAVLDAEPQKPRERQAVAHLILNLFVGQIVKRLQHQHPKHNNDINRLAAGVALLFTRRRQCRRLNLGAEALERHHPINHLKRITLRGNYREPLVRIKKTELTHRTRIPESYCDSQTRTNSGRPLFFEVPSITSGMGGGVDEKRKSSGAF